MFDRVYVINLKSRKDRRDHMKKELEKLKIPSEKIEFFAAFDHTHYENVSMRAAGCSKSHMFIWKKALEQGYRSVLILEDDLNFTVDTQEFNNLVNELYSKYPNFDVCNLAYLGRGKQLCNNFMSSQGVQTASAYIIKPSYMNTIASDIWLATTNLMNGEDYHKNAIDQVWKKYQRENVNWLLMKRIAYQKKCFSSIEQKEVDYKV